MRRVRISFNRPPFVGKETEYIKEAVEKNGMICGDGPFTKKCSQWMKERFQTKNVLLTTSCTHALEMAAFLADIQPGDEVKLSAKRLGSEGYVEISYTVVIGGAEKK